MRDHGLVRQVAGIDGQRGAWRISGATARLPSSLLMWISPSAIVAWEPHRVRPRFSRFSSVSLVLVRDKRASQTL
jgi:hypothetical protein